MNKKQGYYESQNRFDRIDGDNFGGCLKQVFNIKDGIVLEWRIKKENKKMCIIEFYKEGRGYSIYQIEE